MNNYISKHRLTPGDLHWWGDLSSMLMALVDEGCVRVVPRMTVIPRGVKGRVSAARWLWLVRQNNGWCHDRASCGHCRATLIGRLDADGYDRGGAVS